MGEPLTSQSTVLIVMDVQERLYNAMSDEQRSVAVDNVIRLVQGARILQVPLLVTEQYPQGLGSTIEPVGQALKEFDPVPEVVAKVDFDACEDPRFADALERHWAQRDDGGRKRAVVLCGMETHICVYQTARALVARGYEVHVPVDASCCRNAESHRIAEQLLDRAGCVVTSTETVLFELLARAGSESFKQISKLVR